MIPHTCISFNIRRYLTSSWSDSFVWQIMVVSPASLSAGSVSSAYFWSFCSISSLYFYVITHFAQSKCTLFTFFYLSCWILCRKSAVFSFCFILLHKFFCLLSFDCRLQTMPAVKINITKIYPFLDFSPPDRMNISIKKEM